MRTLLIALIALCISDLSNYKPLKTEWIDEDTVISVMCAEREPHCVVVVATKSGIVYYGYEDTGFKIFNAQDEEVEMPLQNEYKMKKLLYEYCSDI